MSGSFTEALRALETTDARPGAVERLLTGLRDALCVELRRRGLWDSPPSYLGIVGSPYWDEEALDDLAEECYLYNLARLRSLRAQLRLKANVDGFVLLNVRHFVFDRQRAHDPLGYRLYEVLAGAAERLLAAGTLHLLAGGPKLRNETLLGFTPGSGAQRLARPEELSAVASSWNDELLELLLAPAGGGDRTPGDERIAERLAELPRRGIAAFRFGDLLEPWKRDARARWARRADEGASWAVDDTEDGALLRLVRAVEPDTSVEDRESFTRLVACVAARLQTGEGSGGQGELWALWSCLARHAGDAAREEVPSQRAVATATGIPRHRLPALYAELGRLVEACRSATPARSAVSPPRQAAEEIRP